MTTPNRDAFDNKETWRKFKKRNPIGFSREQIVEALSAPRTDFQDSPDNPWNKMKKEQEERDQ
jgi:hypothetical protein